MSVVLSYIRPDKTAAIRGTYSSANVAALMAASHLVALPSPVLVVPDKAKRFGAELLRLAITALESRQGAELLHEDSGYLFRLDDAEFPPNVCPCCRALVRPGDHATAGDEDAYCLGCFTWKRDVPACLPANTAHPEGYVPGQENA